MGNLLKIEKITMHSAQARLDKLRAEKGYVPWDERRELDKDLTKKARIYIFHKGETILDNLVERHHRPYDVYKKEILPAILGLIGAQKASWSQDAGCSCGCSPGFIVEDVRGLEVFVDVSDVQQPN